MARKNDSKKAEVREAMGHLFGMQEATRLEIPEVEFDGSDPLHRGALALHVDNSDPLNEAMFLLSEANDLLTSMIKASKELKKVRQRVRRALKALDEQEALDRGFYLAYAETQRAED